MKKSQFVHQSEWTQGIAVGDKSFVEQVKKHLGIRSKGWKVIEDEDDYQLRDAQTGYGVATQNLHHWNMDDKPKRPHIS